MNERNSDNWEKGFDVKSLPDVELLDIQESAPVPAPSPPAPEHAEPLPEPVGDEDTEQGEESAPELERSEPPAAPLPELEIDPRVDPFAGWVSGHPLAEGQSRRELAEEGSAAPAFAILAAGEDPFAGRFAPVAEAAAEPTMSGEESDAEVATGVEAEAAAEAEEVPVEAAAAPAESAQAMLAGTAGAPTASAGQSPVAQGPRPAGTPAGGPGPETSRRGQLAKVVPITSGRSQRLPEGDLPTRGGEGSDTKAMQEFLAGLGDEELDRAVELFERQARQLAAAQAGEGGEDFPAHLLEPFSGVLGTAVGEVELTYRIEEIEDIIDARLPDAARSDADWWSNRAGRLNLGHAAAWVGAGWWSYPDLEAGCVRFRRPV